MSDITTLDNGALEALRQAIVTEQARRLTLADAARIVTEVSTAYATAIKDQPADDWTTLTTRTDRVGPNQRVTLAGIEYRNKSGAWLPTSSGPAQDPTSIWWERITPTVPTVTRPAWSATATYKVGDECTRNGRAYRCIVAHGAAYAGTWGPPTVGVWTDLGPA